MAGSLAGLDSVEPLAPPVIATAPAPGGTVQYIKNNQVWVAIIVGAVLLAVYIYWSKTRREDIPPPAPPIEPPQEVSVPPQPKMEGPMMAPWSDNLAKTGGAVQ